MTAIRSRILWIFLNMAVFVLSQKKSDCCKKFEKPLKGLDCSNINFEENFGPKKYPVNNPENVILHFRECDISTLEDGIFDELIMLETLDLSVNHIKELPTTIFKRLTALKYLDLSHNQLSKFDLLEELKDLGSLNLSNNYIRVLSGELLFHSQGKLTNLSLSNNVLQIIEASVLYPLKSLKDFNLARNPLYCNCEFTETLLWLANHHLDTGGTCSFNKNAKNLTELYNVTLCPSTATITTKRQLTTQATTEQIAEGTTISTPLYTSYNTLLVSVIILCILLIAVCICVVPVVCWSWKRKFSNYSWHFKKPIDIRSESREKEGDAVYSTICSEKSMTLNEFNENDTNLFYASQSIQGIYSEITCVQNKNISSCSSSEIYTDNSLYEEVVSN